jgi:opacity protein-like surface antigen
MRQFIITTFLLFVIISKSVFAQTNTSFSLDAGYGVGILKNSVETFVNTTLIDDKYKSQDTKFSLGNGPSIFGVFTLNTNDNIGFNFGLKYSFLNKVEFNEVSSIGSVTLNKLKTLSANRFAIIPSFQINTDREKLNLFLRLGFSINFINQNLLESTDVDTNSYDIYWEYKAKPRLGVFSMWGISYLIKPKLTLSFAVSFDLVNYQPYYASVSKTVENGVVSKKPNLLPYESEIEFNEWVEDQYNQNPDVNKPLILPIQTFNYSNITFSFGVIFTLSN